MKTPINYSELFKLAHFKIRKYDWSLSEALKSAWKDIKQSLTAVTSFDSTKTLEGMSREQSSYFTGKTKY